jgi:hypothetical protein
MKPLSQHHCAIALASWSMQNYRRDFQRLLNILSDEHCMYDRTFT